MAAFFCLFRKQMPMVSVREAKKALQKITSSRRTIIQRSRTETRQTEPPGKHSPKVFLLPCTFLSQIMKQAWGGVKTPPLLIVELHPFESKYLMPQTFIFAP